MVEELIVVSTRSVVGLSWLLATPAIGPVTALRLADRFETMEELLRASEREIAATAGKRAGKARFDQSRPLSERQLKGTIGWFDADYPAALRNLDSPPLILWIRGELPQSQGVAVVGTRKPTPWGERVAEVAADSAGAFGAAVISGLALGIDGIAHRRALLQGCTTVAVLGCGVDDPSPRQHRQLADDILTAGGALISEVPPGTKASARTLVARNRLQSGLSKATVVAQCGIPSGTLHTARFTLLQGRTLIAPVPTGTYASEPQSAGNLALAASPPPYDAIKATKKEQAHLSPRDRLAAAAPENGEALRSAVADALGETKNLCGAGDPDQPEELRLF